MRRFLPLRRILPLILLWTVWAEAAEYWVDLAGAGAGSADGSDVDNLCAGAADGDCAPSAGDTVYLCNTGTTLTTETAGSSGSPITYDWSCPGGIDGSIDGGESSTDCLIIGDNYITHKDGTVHDCTTTGVWVDGAVNDVIVQDFTAYNIPGTGNDIGNGVCFIIDNLRSTGGDGGGTSLPAYNITFERDTAYNCGRMGFDTQTTGYNIQWIDSVAYGNGGNYVGGGFYSHPYRITRTTGWSVVSGTVYERASLSVNDDVDMVWWNEGNQFLTEVACGGAIAEGEFCYNPGSGATGYLRINIGTDPEGDTIQYRRGPLTGLRWENVISHSNLAPDGDTVHGTGLQVDDLNSDSVVQGGLLYNNAGAGLSIFRSMDITVNSVLSFNNGTDEDLGNGDRANVELQGAGLTLNHVTANGGPTYGIQLGIGEATCNNCAVTNNDVYGARAVAGAFTLNNPATYGNGLNASNEVSGGTVTLNNEITGNPLYAGGSIPSNSAGFKIPATSPLRAAGTYVGSLQDFDNRRFKFPPSIGAWEAAGGDSATARTAAQPRTAR